jgi:hypothetical protein
MPSDAEIEQELARQEAEKAAREQAAEKAQQEAQAEEPAHVATFREGYDILRDDLEGAAQEQATADKQVNGKNGIVTKAAALLIRSLSSGVMRATKRSSFTTLVAGLAKVGRRVLAVDWVSVAMAGTCAWLAHKSSVNPSARKFEGAGGHLPE